MAIFFVLIAVEAALIALTAPIGITMKAYASLAEMKAVVEVRVIGVRGVHVKAELDRNGLRLTVNGKEKQRKKDKKPPLKDGVGRIIAFIRSEKIVRSLRFNAVVGGSDAKDAATGTAAFGLIAGTAAALSGAESDFRAYPDYDNDRLDAQLEVECRINAIQSIRLAALYLHSNGRRKRA